MWSSASLRSCRGCSSVPRARTRHCRGEDAGGVEAVPSQHADVEDDHVRVDLAREADGLVAVGRLGHHLEVRHERDDRARGLAEQDLVVDREQADRAPLGIGRGVLGDAHPRRLRRDFRTYGRIPLGHDGERPEFRTVSWVAMMFSAGMGIGLMFYGVAEPLAHFVKPPPGTVEGGTDAAVETAMA